MAAKMGRPTDSPKESRITARIETDIKHKLDEYCAKHKITCAEGLRRAVIKLLGDE